MATTEQATAIVESISIKAPAERVFAALTQPEQILRWWGSAETCRLTAYDVDLRPGGAWKKTGIDSDGDNFTVSGEYTVVQPPNLLEFTWRTQSQEEAQVPFTKVRYELQEHDGVTNLTVTHSGFVRATDRENHAQGWKIVVQWLQNYVSQAA